MSSAKRNFHFGIRLVVRDSTCSRSSMSRSGMVILVMSPISASRREPADHVLPLLHGSDGLVSKVAQVIERPQRLLDGDVCQDDAPGGARSWCLHVVSRSSSSWDRPVWEWAGDRTRYKSVTSMNICMLCAFVNSHNGFIFELHIH